MSEFEQYEALKRAGLAPAAVYRAAHEAGMGDVDAIRMIRAVFGVSLRAAKEAMIVGSGTAESLEAHEAAAQKFEDRAPARVLVRCHTIRVQRGSSSICARPVVGCRWVGDLLGRQDAR